MAHGKLMGLVPAPQLGRYGVDGRPGGGIGRHEPPADQHGHDQVETPRPIRAGLDLVVARDSVRFAKIAKRLFALCDDELSEWWRIKSSRSGGHV